MESRRIAEQKGWGLEEDPILSRMRAKYGVLDKVNSGEYART